MGTTNIDKHELWQQRIDDYRASCLSAKDFCEAQSYSFHTLRSWMYKLKSKSKNASTCGFVKLTPCESTTEIEQVGDRADREEVQSAEITSITSIILNV